MAGMCDLDGLDLDEDFDLDGDDFDPDLLADLVAGIDLANPGRRGIEKLMDRARDYGRDRADVVLEAVLEAWGKDVPAASGDVSPRGLRDYSSQCLWPGCSLPPKERQGTRGRIPRRCHNHTIEYKRQQDRERLRAKRSGTLVYQECCKEWQQTGHRGPCQQHRDMEKASAPQIPLSAIEYAYLSEGRFHLI